MVDAFGAGASFRDLLVNKLLPAESAVIQAPQTTADYAGSTGHEFLRGLFGAGRPSVTVPLPAATPARAAAKAPAPAKVPAGLGTLTPAAAAVLAAAAGVPAAKAPAAADDLGALGKLSFRQLLTLSQAQNNLQPRGVTKQPSATDAAGAALASIYQQQFKASIDAAGKDPAKQQAAVDAFEKKMLPIALKGNTADEYLYGNQ